MRTLRLHGDQQVSFYDEWYLILINLVPTPTLDKVIPTTNGGLISWRRVGVDYEKRETYLDNTDEVLMERAKLMNKSYMKNKIKIVK